MVKKGILRRQKWWWSPVAVLSLLGLACTCSVINPGPAGRATPTPFPMAVSSGGEPTIQTPVTVRATATPAAALTRVTAGGASPSTPTRPPAQATPVPTSTVTPTQLRRVSPEELLPNISWGGWGGGGNRADCGDGIANVYLTVYGGSIPQRYSRDYEEGDSVMIGEIVSVHGCDFPAGEQVQVTFLLPDGTSEQGLMSAGTQGSGSDGLWSTKWYTVPGEPVGLYRVEIRSASAILLEEFRVVSPAKPIFTVALTCIEDEPVAYGILTGFVPAEEVLIARYSCCGWREEEGNLMDYWYVKVGLDGSAIIQLPNESDALVLAIGAQRQVEAEDGELLVSAFDYVYCPDW
jgi:hypothetical protein